MTPNQVSRQRAPFVLHRGEGFQLVVPKGATQNVSSAYDGRWQYREFLFRVSPEESAESTGVFYFRTQDPPVEPDLPRVRKLCREVIRRHLFEDAFRLRMTSGIEGFLGSYPSMVLKFRFSIASAQVSGPMHLYTVHDTTQGWLLVLGIFTEQGGDAVRENEVLQMLEHKIVMSFQLDR